MLFKSIWVIVLAHILLYFFQEMSFVVGTVSKTDLGNLIRLNYSRRMSIFLWFSSELAIISADVQEVIGATIALKVLFNLNLYAGKFFTNSFYFKPFFYLSGCYNKINFFLKLLKYLFF